MKTRIENSTGCEIGNAEDQADHRINSILNKLQATALNKPYRWIRPWGFGNKDLYIWKEKSKSFKQTTHLSPNNFFKIKDKESEQYTYIIDPNNPVKQESLLLFPMTIELEITLLITGKLDIEKFKQKLPEPFKYKSTIISTPNHKDFIEEFFKID